MRGARYVHLIPWTLQSGSEQVQREVVPREGRLKALKTKLTQGEHFSKIFQFF
jgi:hypothetical protein